MDKGECPECGSNWCGGHEVVDPVPEIMTNKVSENKLQELIDKYSEDTFADLLDLAHYTIDSADDIVNGLEELQIIREDIKNILLEHLQALRENEALIEEIQFLSDALFDSNLSIHELETIRRRHISFMKEINNKTT